MPKIPFSLEQINNRIQQPTAELMAELGGAVKCGNGQVYAIRQTGAPVLAVAHCDYRDCGSNHFRWHKDRIYSSRLDDRLGVYVLLDVLPQLGIHVDILLTDDEECGRSTAQYFAPAKHDYNWIVQFDRSGTDAVTYDYGCMDSYVADHFTLGYGSFSDICWLQHLGIGGVNIGTAYYDEHTLDSYAVLSELRAQIKRFAGFYAAMKSTRVEYFPAPDTVGDVDAEWESLAGSWRDSYYGYDDIYLLCVDLIDGGYRETEFDSEYDACDWIVRNDIERQSHSILLLDYCNYIVYDSTTDGPVAPFVPTR